MKHTGLIAMVIVPVLAVGAASAQSLGDAARAARKNKPEASPTIRHYDNDNLPVNDTLSVVGPEPATATPGAATQKPGPATSAIDRQKAAEEMQKKMEEQKQRIDSLNREIDLTQREDKVRAAAFYSDPGIRLRNSLQWDKEQAQSKSDAEEKQKALDAAKQQYDELQDQARRAGIAPAEKKPDTNTAPDKSTDNKGSNNDKDKDKDKDKPQQ